MNYSIGHTLRLVLMILIAVGAGFLCAIPYLKFGRTRPRWVGRAYVLAGLGILMMSVLNVLYLTRPIALSVEGWQWVYEAKVRLGAFGVGILVTILMAIRTTGRPDVAKLDR